MHAAHRAARSLAGVPPAQGEGLMPSYSQDDVVRWLTGQADRSLDLTEDVDEPVVVAAEHFRDLNQVDSAGLMSAIWPRAAQSRADRRSEKRTRSVRELRNES